METGQSETVRQPVAFITISEKGQSTQSQHGVADGEKTEFLSESG
jgi:hypothetical protein